MKVREVVKLAEKLTTKQEKFVLGLVEGKSQRQAYIDAGYSTEGKKNEYIDTRACHLFKNSKVLARYNELMGKIEKKSIMTAQEVLESLTVIARADALDYFQVKDGKVILTDTDKIPQEKRAVISGIKQGRDGMEVKLYSKMDALKELARHHGVDVPKQEEEKVEPIRIILERGKKSNG